LSYQVKGSSAFSLTDLHR